MNAICHFFGLFFSCLSPRLFAHNDEAEMRMDRGVRNPLTISLKSIWPHFSLFEPSGNLTEAPDVPLVQPKPTAIDRLQANHFLLRPAFAHPAESMSF